MDKEQEELERVTKMGSLTALQAVQVRQAIEENRVSPPTPPYRRVTLHSNWRQSRSGRSLYSLLALLGLGLALLSVWLLTSNPGEPAASKMLYWLGIIGGIVFVGLSFWLQGRRR